MCHGLRQGAVYAQAPHEARRVPARGVVPLEHERLEHIGGRVGLEQPLAHGHLHVLLVREGVAAAQTDGPHERTPVGHRLPACVRGGDGERRGGDLLPHVHGARHGLGPGEGLGVEERPAILGNHAAVDDGARHAKIREVLEEYEVGALARGDAAQIVLHLEARGRVDGYHLDGRERVYALGHGQAQHVVQMPVLNERAGVVVVRHEAAQARVHLAARHGGGQVVQVVPRRALADLRVHAQAQLGQRVLSARGLVAGRDAGGYVGVEPTVRLGRGVVARHGLAGRKRGGHLVHGTVRAGQDARVVHHLAQAAHAGPAHGLADVVRAHRGARVLEARDGRHAARGREHALERHARRVGRHGAHGGQARHVARLVRVVEHARRAVRHHGTRVLRGPHHGALYVHVAVEEAGGHILAARVYDLRGGAHAVPRGVTLHAHVRHAPLGHGDVCVLQHLARADVHQTAVGDDHVGRLLPLRHPHEAAVALPQGLCAKRVLGLIGHGCSSLAAPRQGVGGAA